MNPLLLTLPLILLASTLTLLLSVRGRRTGTHPTCRRCDYNLSHRPPTSTHCPECGSDLTHPRSTRTGHRRRRPLFVVLSLFAFLATFAATSHLAWRCATDPALLRYQPTFLLPLHFRYGPLAPQALAELQSRIRSNKASPAAATPVLTYILARQADPAIKWNPAHGDFVESLRFAGLLPDDSLWDRYVHQSTTFAARIRPNVRNGDPLPQELTVTSRLASTSRLRIFLSASLAFDHRRQPPLARFGGNPWFNPSGISPFREWESTTPKNYFPLPLGPHTAHLAVEVQLYDGSPRTHPDPDNSSVTFTLRQSFDLPFTLHPSDHPTVRIIDDPATRDAISRALFLLPLAPPQFALNVRNAPAPLAYKVTCRTDDKAVALTNIAVVKGESVGWLISPIFRKLLPTQFDLLLQPDPVVAANTIDITEIYAGDITLHNLSTEPFKPATRLTR